jgi:hypothetical protein
MVSDWTAFLVQEHWRHPPELDDPRRCHYHRSTHLVGRQDRSDKLRHYQATVNNERPRLTECDEEFVGLQDKYDTVASILDALPAHYKLIIIIALLNACRKALMRDGGLTRPEATERLVKYLNDFEEERDQAPRRSMSPR